MARQSSAGTMPVLLTRPEAQSEEFSRRLAARFGAAVRPLIAPLMAPEILATPLPEGIFSAVIFTSAMGVQASAGMRDRLPKLAYCVGRQTSAAAREAGFAAISADGDAAALAQLIRSAHAQGRLLHLAGAETAGDIAAQLSAAGFPTLRLVLYRQVALPVPAELTTLMQTDGPVVVPVFSPRSARLLVAALDASVRARLMVAAISAAVADACAKLPLAELDLARQPDAEGMLDSIGRLLEMPAAP